MAKKTEVKKEEKTVLDVLEEKKLVVKLPAGPELVAKHRDDSGVIQSFKTKEDEEFSVDEVAVKIDDGLTIKAKDRQGKLTIVDITEEGDPCIGDHNLGHLPDY